MMNVSARDHPGHMILFRKYVSRKAAGKGRAVLEGVGLDSETIDACFNGSNEEEAVQAGLIKWCGGRGYQLATWGVLFAAMEYAQLAQQHVHDLKKESGLFAQGEPTAPQDGQSHPDGKELSRKRQRSSTRSSDDLALQQSVAKKCLHDYTDLKMDLLAQDIADLDPKYDPSVIIKLLYSNFLFRIPKLLTPHFSEVKIAADNHCQLGLHPKAVAEGAIGSAGSVDNLLNLMSVKTMWEDTCFFRKAVAAIPASAPERQVAEAILLHYNTNLDIFNRATLLRDALAKETKIDEKKTGSNEDDKMIPLKITSAKPNIGFTREDCYRILEQLLSRAYGIPPGKIICQDTYESNSTTVTFVVPSQYMHDIIQCSMLLPTVWVLLELDIIEVSIPGVFTFIPSVGCFLSLLRGSKPFTADLLEVTEVLPYQTYCLLDPNTKEPLSDRPLSTKRIEQHWDSHVGLVPDPHCSVLESGDIDILATHSEEAVIPPEGSIVDTTDELQSKVGELEDKVTDLERKVANLFMDNVALTTKLKASQGVEKEQQEEISHLKERLVQALRAQDTDTQELSLLRTRESELEEINVLEETRSALEAEVEKMKQLEILPSDVEQLAKARLTMGAENSKVVKDKVARMRADIEKVRVKKRERLQTMDFFLLDNSIRESTVGQLRSHTIENKKAIFEQVKKCGIKDIVVATFSHMTRVDDAFCQWLVDSGQDRSHFYSFSEVTEGLKDGAYDTETVPVSLRKNKKYGLANTVFEVDLASKDVQWGVKFTVNDFCMLMLKWIKWVQKNISQDARILLNLRDFPVAMTEVPERVLEVVTFLARLPDEHRMFGLCFEDPFGEFLPEELEAWTASLRRTMDSNGWSSGKLLAHIHQKWDLQTASQLDCLSAGADGVWASLCEEGAALGHACSSITMMNLVRMGNKKIQMKYNCKHLRTAAAEITRITTGKDPHPKQPIYGARACDLVFGFLGTEDFDVADFFGVEAPKRITTLATTDMLKERLTKLFGVHEQFNDEIASKMKEKMLEDLHEGRKEEYMSKVGIAMLFDRAGGKLTPAIADVIAIAELTALHHQSIIDEIRKEWDEWDSQDEKRNDDCLQFDSFYHGFMQPYFGCYRCVDTQLAFKAIDLDADGLVDWNEFLVYIKWALHEYPEITSADETLSVAFEKGLIPAMRDEKLNNREHYKSSSFRFSS